MTVEENRIYHKLRARRYRKKNREKHLASRRKRCYKNTN